MNTTRIKALIITFPFWLLIFIYGCATVPPSAPYAIYGVIDKIPLEIYMDKGILNDEPCALPCWKNIIPGKTTNEDAIKIVLNDPYGDKYARVKEEPPKGKLLFSTRYPGRQLSDTVYWENGIVTEIELGLNFPFTVEEMLAKYGIPEGIIGTFGGTSGHYYIIVFFYYPSKGYEFRAYTKEGISDLEPTTSMDVMSAYPPMSIEERIKKYLDGASFYPKVVKKIRQWKGYGNVVDKYYGGDAQNMYIE